MFSPSDFSALILAIIIINIMLGLANNVASKVASVIQTGELSRFAISDKKILDEIYSTHVHADDSFDDDSLFIIVENILKRATQTVDKIVQVIK